MIVSDLLVTYWLWLNNIDATEVDLLLHQYYVSDVYGFPGRKVPSNRQSLDQRWKRIFAKIKLLQSHLIESVY